MIPIMNVTYDISRGNDINAYIVLKVVVQAIVSNPTATRSYFKDVCIFGNNLDKMLYFFVM